MKSYFITAVVLTFHALGGLAAEAKSTDFVLVTSPSGDFQLVRKGDGAIWLIPAKNPSEHSELSGVENGASGADASDESKQPPRCFVSPDEQWIFVETDIGEDNTTGILYQREKKSADSDTPLYQPAIAEGFANGAWDFVCQDRKLKENDIGIEDRYGSWRRSLYFGAWSADSARLLIGLSGSVGKPKEPEDGGPTQYPSSVSELCYFNTQTGAFEVTDRLQKANVASAKDNSAQSDLNAAETGAVLSAESLGHESPEPSVTDRFKQADATLNDVYKRLLASLPSAAKIELQDEERAWLNQRDIFATVHSLQSWSPFPNASRIEGQAIATEKRVGELRERLPAHPKS
jgi:uncharacterized protein YecT (DUF1311 family)